MLLHSQCIATETKEAKEEFSEIAENENTRVQQVAELENERLLQKKRTNGTIRTCPVCLEEIPLIVSHEDLRKVRSGMQMPCCNAHHCSTCKAKSIEFMRGNYMKNAKCFNCREPFHDNVYWAKTIKPNDQRHWLMCHIGLDYMKGTDGLKKNTKKGLKLIKRAAELGDGHAQDILANVYYSGDIECNIPKCLERARYYAEKGVDQGSVTSQSVLANLFMDPTLSESLGFNRDEEDEKVFQLLTLASYQGSHVGRFWLGGYYAEKMKKGEEGKKNVLLSLYWYGKAGEEVQLEDPMGCISMTFMASFLNVAVSHIWHPRHDCNRDPLPGYSHIPFCTWALAKGGSYSTQKKWSNPWKSQCANCNKASQEDKQFKACARCKAFHYCSKKCQIKHWKDGHKVDCKGHWIEEFFPNLRMTQNKM